MPMTFDDIKKLSPKYKAIILCLIYLVLGYFYYFYFLQTNMEMRSKLKVELQDMEKQLAEKERLSAQLDKYKKELEVLKEAFKVALTKLPVRKEIPELLRSVSYSGKKAGINFLLFEPQPTVKKPIGGTKEEQKKQAEQKPQGQKQPEQKTGDVKKKEAEPPIDGDYYEEIPVKVTVKSSYHKAATFFEKIARLPRIINVEEISIDTSKKAEPAKGKELQLETSCILKTYMFVQKNGEKDKKIDEKKP